MSRLCTLAQGYSSICWTLAHASVGLKSTEASESKNIPPSSCFCRGGQQRVTLSSFLSSAELCTLAAFVAVRRRVPKHLSGAPFQLSLLLIWTQFSSLAVPFTLLVVILLPRMVHGLCPPTTAPPIIFFFFFKPQACYLSGCGESICRLVQSQSVHKRNDKRPQKSSSHFLGLELF